MASSAEDASAPRGVAAAAQRGITGLQTPSWFRTLGIGAWLTLGIAGVLALSLFLIALVAEVAIPLAIAAVLAAILVPLVDRLERWRVPRWLGATFVLIIALSVVVATVAVIVNGITSQSDEIWARLEASLQQVDENASLPGSFDQIVGAAHSVVRLLTTGILGSVFSSASSLVVGSVLAVFMLLFLLKDWQQINTWTAGHIGLPEVVGRTVLDGTVSAFRGYAAGLTLIGAANAVVVALGAVVLDVPLVGTIALVSFITSYVPYLGAFVAGAFAVLIAYGSGGPRRRAGDAGHRPAGEQHDPEPGGAVRLREPAAPAPARRTAHRDHGDDALRGDGSDPRGAADLGRRERAEPAPRSGPSGGRRASGRGPRRSAERVST